MDEITYRETDRVLLADLAERVRSLVDYRLEVSMTDTGGIKVAGCKGYLIGLVTQAEDGREHLAMIGGKSPPPFLEDRLTDALAAVLSSARIPAGSKVRWLDIGDWQQIADRLAARKDARLSA